jgi:hypothetical protein
LADPPLREVVYGTLGPEFHIQHQLLSDSGKTILKVIDPDR